MGPSRVVPLNPSAIRQSLFPGLGACVVLALAGPGSPASALEVILVRHGHKDVSRGDFNLSPQGLQRALTLGRLIPACFGAPTRIISYPFNPRTGKNSRSYQTLVPLGVATGVTIELAEDGMNHSEAVGSRLRARLSSTQERVVMAWEHRRMPDLAKGLGWPAMRPIADDDFEQLLIFRYRDPSGLPTVQLDQQSALLQRPCFQRATTER